MKRITKIGVWNVGTLRVSQRIQKANGAFLQLYPVWKNSKISTGTKLTQHLPQ
jgi:hypothetical protein